MNKNCFLNCCLVYNEEVEETDSETDSDNEVEKLQTDPDLRLQLKSNVKLLLEKLITKGVIITWIIDDKKIPALFRLDPEGSTIIVVSNNSVDVQGVKFTVKDLTNIPPIPKKKNLNVDIQIKANFHTLYGQPINTLVFNLHNDTCPQVFICTLQILYHIQKN